VSYTRSVFVFFATDKFAVITLFLTILWSYFSSWWMLAGCVVGFVVTTLPRKLKGN
jgi:hypothetical protein